MFALCMSKFIISIRFILFEGRYYTGTNNNIAIDQCLRRHCRYRSATHQPMEDSIKKSIQVPLKKGEG